MKLGKNLPISLHHPHVPNSSRRLSAMNHVDQHTSVLLQQFAPRVCHRRPAFLRINVP